MNPDQDGKIFVGKSEKPEYLTLPMAIGTVSSPARPVPARR